MTDKMQTHSRSQTWALRSHSAPRSPELRIIFHFWVWNQCVHNQIPIDSTHILLTMAEKKMLKRGKDECINIPAVSLADNKAPRLSVNTGD